MSDIIAKPFAISTFPSALGKGGSTTESSSNFKSQQLRLNYDARRDAPQINSFFVLWKEQNKKLAILSFIKL